MKNIVLSGSMKVKEEILKVGKELEKNGFCVLLPEECMKKQPKKIASRQHFNRIMDPENEILLVVNSNRNGIDNYIGANSFAEIAFGFQFNKNVYLLNDIYEPFKDELIGWNIKVLKGDLSCLIDQGNKHN